MPLCVDGKQHDDATTRFNDDSKIYACFNVMTKCNIIVFITELL